MTKLIRSILILILFFVGSASAGSTEVEQRISYTTSLNSMVSIVMNWYGSLITSHEPVVFITTEYSRAEYRSHYPNDIRQIHIKSTDLIKLEGKDQYQFNVKSIISYHKNDGGHSQLVSETFVFHVPLLAMPIIENITREDKTEIQAVQTSEFNRPYYKVREFAYSWLAYLDGVTSMKPILNGKKWLDKAHYTLKIGGQNIQGSVASVLAQRKHYLAKGGHLLRSLDVERVVNKQDTFKLALIIEWKGKNKEGKPMLAKIHQEIEYKILADNSWDVISIKEEHLLPDLAPWQELLC